MIRRLLKPIYSRWQLSSLRAKLLIPIMGLMAFSLLASTLAFMMGTARTQEQLVTTEARIDEDRVIEALDSRAGVVMTAAAMLARDTTIAQALRAEDGASLPVLNSRAVAVRDRLTLDLVQIYNREGECRTNLVLSDLYRQSSLLDLVQTDDPALREVDGRLLLLSRAKVSGNGGTIVTGIDMESELQRIVSEYGLLSEIALVMYQTGIGTTDGLPFDAPGGQVDDKYVLRRKIDLGSQTVQLLTVRPTADIQKVTQAGMTVMVISTLLTAALLFLVSLLITRFMARPIHDLAESAQALAKGDWSHQVELDALFDARGVQTRDEIGLLAQAFAHMVTELRELYAGLEQKVEARTQQLAAAEERYRRFFEEDLAGDFICDRTGRVMACNSAFANIFGFESCQQAMGIHLSEIYPDQIEWQNFWKVFQRERKLEYYETRMKSLSGNPVHIIQNVIGTFDEKGKLTEIKGYIVDNSERKSLEEQLRQSQKMEAIGRLAGGIAHDFNNVLTVIIGYSQLLEKSMERNPNASAQYLQQVKTILNAGDRAAVLVRQLLAFSRKQMLQPSIVNLNETVTNMTHLLQRMIGEDVELINMLDSKLQLISADPSQIEQVIMNLAVNARDAMPNGGTLIIETKNTYLDTNYAREHVEVVAGTYAMLAISDNGTGMDHETMRLVFEPFFTTKSQGTGLGLATVYGIVKQSGGHISVYSELGRGTTFKVYLPVAEEQAKPNEDIKQEEFFELGTETVLLVEDEDLVRQLAVDVLLDRGYYVLEAADGEEALKVADAHRGAIDIVITDVVMPGMSGRELADRLSSLYPDLSILFMSGYTDSAIVNHGVLDPDVNFIGKPFSPKALAQKIQDILKPEENIVHA